MPLYMDIHHKIDGLTAEAIKGAHEQDVKVQKKHGPSKEAANAVHREAHGLVADEIIEVQEGA